MGIEIMRKTTKKRTASPKISVMDEVKSYGRLILLKLTQY